MDQKGITKKQFWIQMFPAVFYLLLAGFWIISGIVEGEAIHWAFGAVFLVLALILVVSLIIQRKRHLIDDAQLDEQATHNFKESMKGMGIVYGIIAFGFLIAFGIAALFK